MKRIEWVKWQDPMDLIENKENDVLYDEQNEIARHVRVIAGPYGLIPLGSHGLMTKSYNMWILHANFSITKSIILEMEKIEGIEILHPWTRYRAWVGIGSIFNEEAVKNEIEIAFSDKKRVAKKISFESVLKIMQKHLNSKYEFWAICRMKNGKMICFDSYDRNSLIRKIRDEKSEDNIVSLSWENTKDDSSKDK